MAKEVEEYTKPKSLNETLTMSKSKSLKETPTLNEPKSLRETLTFTKMANILATKLETDSKDESTYEAASLHTEIEQLLSWFRNLK